MRKKNQKKKGKVQKHNQLAESLKVILFLAIFISGFFAMTNGIEKNSLTGMITGLQLAIEPNNLSGFEVPKLIEKELIVMPNLEENLSTELEIPEIIEENITEDIIKKPIPEVEEEVIKVPVEEPAKNGPVEETTEEIINKVVKPFIEVPVEELVNEIAPKNITNTTILIIEKPRLINKDLVIASEEPMLEIMVTTTLPGDTTYNSTNLNTTNETGFAHNSVNNVSNNAVLVMDFNVNSSPNVRDYTFYNNDANENGGLRWNITGGHGHTGGYSFDGSSAWYLNIPHSNSLNTSGPYAISYWVKSSETGNVAFMEKGVDGALVMQPVGDNRFFYLDAVVAATGSIEDEILNGQWNHIVATTDGIKKHLFVNGVGRHTGALTASDTNAAFQVGSRSGSFPFLGSIDDLMIFAKNLTLAEISNLNNSNFSLYNRSGSMLFSNQGIDLSRFTRININLTNCQTNNGTNLSVSINQETQINFSNCVVANLSITNQSSNSEIKINFLNDVNNFFTPLIIGNITIDTLNYLPTQGTPTLISTNPATNNTNQNLTVNNQSTADADGDIVKNIYNWKINDTSITVLNMPFEGINWTDTNNAHDYSGYGNKGVIINENNNATWNATGGYDGKGAYKFDGINDYISVPSAGGTNFSFTMWVKFATTGNFDPLNFISGSGIASFPSRYNNKFSVYNGAAWRQSTTTINTNVWTHLGMTFDDGSKDLRLYINGVLEDNSTSATYSTGYVTMIGRYTGAGRLWNGSIDEVMIFNRTLSANQIWNLYSNQTNKITSDETLANQNWSACITPNDNKEDGVEVCSNGLLILGNTLPTMTLNAPANNSNISVNYVLLNTTVTDAEGSNTTVYFQGDGRVINFTINQVTGANVTYNWTSLSEGTHNWSVIANDGTGNATNITYFFTTDLSAPLVTLVAPINNSNFSTNNQTFNFTVIENYTSVDKVVFSFDNFTGTSFNVTAINQSGNWVASYNVSGLAEGPHIITVFANDTLGFMNNTLTLQITVDRSSPAVTISNPSAGVNLSSGTKPFNVTVQDSNLSVDKVVFSFNNATGNSFNKTATNKSGVWDFDVDLTILTEGAHVMTVFANDSVGNMNSTETISFNVDRTGPVITNVSFTPNSSNLIDPDKNITFNVSVTDSNLSIDKVILQLFNGSSWSNSTTASQGNNFYEVNITMQSINTNYTFNIWANDSAGNVNISTNRTFSSIWDCTWTVTPATLGQTAGWDQNKNLGNIWINNTGDVQHSNNNCSLDLRLTYDLTEGRIYFDSDYIKPSSTYTVIPGNNQSIVTNATFLTEVKQEDAVITVNEIRTRANETQKNVTVTIVSTTGGPYLYQKVTSYPTSVSLTNSNFSLQGYIRNLVGDDTFGNTAFNITFNWTLPSGFLLRTGNASVFYLNISNSSQVYNNLNLSFNSTNLPTISPGEVNITLSAQGYNSTGGFIIHAGNSTLLTEIIQINLQCYNVSDGIKVTGCGSLDGDIEATVTTTTTTTTTTSSGGGGSAAGGGGGGGLTAEQKETLFQTEETYHLVRGGEESFIMKLENPLEGDLVDISIDIEGFLSKYLIVEPTKIEGIPEGKSVNVTIHIKAPEYFTQGKHELKFIILGTAKLRKKVGGYFTTEDTLLQENRLITLFIHEISKAEALAFIAEGERFIQEMIETGFNAKEIKLIFSQTEGLMRKDEYEQVKELYEIIKNKKKKAEGTVKLLEEISKLMKKASLKGLKMTESKRLVLLSRAALERGDYETSFKRAEEAKVTFALETVGKFNPIGYVINNWPLVSLGLIGITMFSYLGLLFTKRKFAISKLKSLNKEEDVILGLIKEIQKECFEKRKLSMREYLESLTQYEDKLNKVTQESIKQETIKSNAFRIFKREEQRITEERKKLIELIKITQKKYMNTGNIETRIYENRMRSYTERLYVLEERIADLEAKKAMKNRKKKVKPSKRLEKKVKKKKDGKANKKWSLLGWFKRKKGEKEDNLKVEENIEKNEEPEKVQEEMKKKGRLIEKKKNSVTSSIKKVLENFKREKVRKKAKRKRKQEQKRKEKLSKNREIQRKKEERIRDIQREKENRNRREERRVERKRKKKEQSK